MPASSSSEIWRAVSSAGLSSPPPWHPRVAIAKRAIARISASRPGVKGMASPPRSGGDQDRAESVGVQLGPTCGLLSLAEELPDGSEHCGGVAQEDRPRAAFQD